MRVMPSLACVAHWIEHHPMHQVVEVPFLDSARDPVADSIPSRGPAGDNYFLS